MITVKSLIHQFDKKGIAGLNSISFSLEKGKILAIMGPNGCGKSTLLNAISGKIKTDIGTIEIKGICHHFNFRELPPSMNVQKYLFSQIEIQIDEEKKIQLTRDFADIFEFTFQLKQTCSELSQGQQQKVMLSAELINNPDILLMDEPFVHLDPLNRQEILKSLFHYVRNREITVLWVTHEREEAMRFADSMALIQHGKIEQFGKTITFMEPKNLFTALFMGHKNFFIVNKFDEKWKTPWGQWEKKFPGNEAVMVIPPQSLTPDTSSMINFKILSSTPQPFYQDVALEWNNKEYHVYLPKNFMLESTQLPLKVDLSNCFLIPL